jgi:hypothetical protein
LRRDTDLEATLVAKYAALSPLLNERARRVWAAAESAAIGYGGDAVVSSATGLSRNTIKSGRRELTDGGAPAGRLRRAGAGRPPIESRQPAEMRALAIDPHQFHGDWNYAVRRRAT